LKTKNFQLWWQFTLRDIESRHKGSYLGYIWMLVNPLLEFTIYTTVFSLIFQGRYGVIENEPPASYALGIFLSLTLFRLVAETLSIAPTVIVNQPNLVKKVVFPVQVLPLCSLASIIVRVGISLLLFFIGFLIWGPGLSLTNLWLPLVMLPVVALALGLSWLLAALGVFLRDISQITGALSLIILYTSAIFYSENMVIAKSPFVWSILRFNPLLHAVEDSRRVMLWQLPPHPASLAYALGFGLTLCLIGYTTFQKLRPAFADVI
jgi:lipopolysaccharide transport system permease protein